VISKTKGSKRDSKQYAIDFLCSFGDGSMLAIRFLVFARRGAPGFVKDRP
jgi:hypothetical protein